MNNSIYPCIWCNNNAREMADFYGSVFPKVMDEVLKMKKIDMHILKNTVK